MSQDSQESQWQQPPFAQPTFEQPTAPGFGQPPRFDAGVQPLTGAVIVPGAHVPPATALESGLRVLSGLIWPIAIVLWIFVGVGGFGNVIGAIIISALCKHAVKEMARRRRESVRPIVAPDQGLR